MTDTSDLWNPADADTADVLMEFAGATDDQVAIASACDATHTNLLGQLADAGRRQLGPVEWRTYDPAAARAMLEAAGLIDQPGAAGLLSFLSTPDTLLVVASVACTRVS